MPVTISGTTGIQTPGVANSGTSTAALFSGPLAGNVTGNASTATLATTVADGAVTPGKLSGFPAFSACIATDQSIPASLSEVKVQFQTELFDTNNNYDPTTNFRFTPTVAGYYQINAMVAFKALGSFYGQLNIKKNNVLGIATTAVASGGTNWPQPTLSVLVFLNGTTDYVECFAMQSTAGNVSLQSGLPQSYFQGFLARPA
jgi:hypothetical protein